MKRRFSTACAFLLVALCLPCAGVALALPSGLVPRPVPIVDPSVLCRAAIHMAEADKRTPSGLLGAIATVESGRRNPATGKLAPWPWTIDADGVGHIYLTEAAAVTAAQRFQHQGTHSLDIGCMQVDLQQHPDAFANLAQAFSPIANALYAADFLVRLKRRLGSWAQAVAAYHSQTPAVGAPYARKVLTRWKASDHATMPLLSVASRPQRLWAVPVTKPKTDRPKADSKLAAKPGAVPLRRFGLGGFAFAALHGHARLLPIATSRGGVALPHISTPRGDAPAGSAGRGLAAYRRTPIPIAGPR